LTADGLGNDARLVVVEVAPTDTGVVPELNVKLLSPEYAALMVYAPLKGSGATHVAEVVVADVLTVTAEQSVPDCGPV
jgi:Na+/pantothenate symporter